MPPTAAPRSFSIPQNGNATGNTRRPQHLPVESFHPIADSQTYRDLLIFEERLKQNAARLVKRKKKYQTFLVLLCATISFFAYTVFLDPQEWQPLHYLNVSILLVTGTMLFLFFASGMYAERITAANKFVPQANRSLRNFNMYLNTRKGSRRSFFSLLRPATSSTSPSLHGTPKIGSLPSSEQNNQGRRTTMQHQTSARRLLIPAIPPTSNPRGELIFSSKVTTPFREGYERYRAAFERRRKEKLEERRWNGWRGWWFLGGKGEAKNFAGVAEKGNLSERAKISTSLAPNKGSPRLTKIRLRSGTNASMQSVAASENSSRASSRASSPSSSPSKEKRVATLGQGRTRKESQKGSTRSEDSTTELPDSNKTSHHSTVDAVPECDDVQGTISPDPTSVADTVDDRTAPEATLREPEEQIDTNPSVEK
ncbi:hypothetical protein CBS101457_003576 [Exobasidium rhododendri]|nr:hypothetical protein CBS101457_003576 [Exobasidium rhododendri]